jgi:hypothetical protein
MKTHSSTDKKMAAYAVKSFFLLWLFSVVSLFIFIDFSASAQNGVLIGPTAGTANASAMLEVAASNKGFLLPRVDLVALANGTTPINAPAPGLLVYNLGGGGVPAVGIYYWDGSANAWVQLTSGGLSGSGTTNQLAKWTSSSAIGNSLIFDDNTYVGVGNTNPLGMLDVKGSGTTSATYGFGVRNNADVYNFAIADDGIVTVTSLAGTGDRPVYADGTGMLKTQGVPVVYSYTGADQTYIVPAGVTSLTIKLWGAGGGGGHRGGWGVNGSGFSGGAGGFTVATLAVSPSQSLTVIVGGGGHGGNVNSTAASYGGGGRSCGGTDCVYSAQGGGRSAIRSGSTELLTAGGGGGGGVRYQCAACECAGGAGGGYVGQSGMGGSLQYSGGRGATINNGGYGGSNMSSRNGINGGAFAGGYAGGTESYGAGGGGGYYGGGGGGYQSNSDMGGGGGGSGYIGGVGVTNGLMQGGDRANPGGSLDPHYVHGIAVGGLGYLQTTPLYGGNGRVVIIPN